jgi:hypothetical protein
MRRRIVVAVLSMVLVVATAGPAFANHPHFVDTPNGNCHQVAEGQTSIDKDDRGGHKFHDNVHKGAADHEEGSLTEGYLGHGNSPVRVWGACL